MPRIVIAAGGTAGHVVPAVAVADELRASGADVTFIGTSERVEAELVPAAGYELHHISVSALDRHNPVRAAGAALRAGGAVRASLRLLRRIRPAAVLAGGGYVAGPVGLAAALARMPLVLSESDSRLGVANRMLAPFARRVCLAFPLEGRAGERYLVTGRPVPRALLEADRGTAREHLGVPPDVFCLLVFGGSLGARSINLAAMEAFAATAPALAGMTVLHVAGRRDHAELAERLQRLQELQGLQQEGSPDYRLHEYLPDMADALFACDLAVTRSGGSVFELAAAGSPAVLVPYPHASGSHQEENARWMEGAGAAIVIPDEQLDAARLAAVVSDLAGDRARLDAMARAARSLARPQAARQIADELLAAAEDGDRQPAGLPSGLPSGSPSGSPSGLSSGLPSSPPGAKPFAGATTPATDAAPWRGRRLHFVGIGGAGMSGLALVARALGADVSGCDRAESGYTHMLSTHGIEPSIGHSPDHVGDGMELVVSTAIPDDAPELRAARARGAPVVHRARLLAEVAALRRLIAVAGTHGKTTTAAMTAQALTGAGLDPSFLVGAELRDGADGEEKNENRGKNRGERGEAAVNAAWGAGGWLVAEADESDRSFLELRPELAVVTNVELDHHSTYHSLQQLEDAFRSFLRLLPKEGTAVLPNNPALLDLAPELANVRSFGIEDDPPTPRQAPDVHARAVSFDGERTGFELFSDGAFVCEVQLPVPGRHNVLNALACLAACELAGADLEQAAAALSSFRPAARRFEHKGRAAGVSVVDDYAHHPTEVAATLDAARSLKPRRLVAVFQPHLYSRTLHLHRELGRELARADVVVVLDVYPARERPEGELAGVTGKLVADACSDQAHGREVWWLPTLEEAEPILTGLVREGDLVVTLGAGDVDRLADALVQRLSEGAQTREPVVKA